MRLQEKVAIITGAGNGIGKAMALKFAKEGAMVIIADIDEEKARQVADEINGLGGIGMALRVDVSKRTDCGPDDRQNRQ